MKKSNNGGWKKMEIQKNKPKDKIRNGRISLLRWENTSEEGEIFSNFSLSKTLLKRNEEDPSRFEGQVFSINGLTMNDLESLKEVIIEMQEKLEMERWSQ
jgi:hypothetical protein